jgi:hypothetical protein
MAEYTEEQRIAEGNRLLALNEINYGTTQVSSAPYTPPPAPTTQQLTQAERDALAALSPEELEALRQFNATATEEQKAMLRRMAAGNVSVDSAVNSGDTGTREPTPFEAFVTQQEAMLEAQRLQDAENALEIIKAKLAEYGLEGLADLAHNLLLDGASPDSVVLQLRDTPEFATRFPGMQIRRDNKMSAIAPDQYIALERFYKQVMMAAGMPEGFYDSVDDFAEFIGNDVDEDEFKDRVTMAAVAVQNIDPYLKGQLRDLYGIGVENEGELIAYYLDPQRGTDIIEQRLQLEAAGLSSASIGALGSGFNQKTAEQLADRNIQKREIADRFRGQRAITQQLVGEDEFTASEFAAAEFGLDSDATADLARLRELRAQRGVRQSGALLTRAGATGLSTAT